MEENHIPPPRTDCLILTGRLEPHEICFVNAMLDDMNHTVVVRTENSEEGRMEYWVAKDLVEEFKELFYALRDNFGIDMTLGDPIPQSMEMLQFERKNVSEE